MFYGLINSTRQLPLLFSLKAADLARNCLGCIAVREARVVLAALLFQRLVPASGAFFSFGWRGLRASFSFGFDRLPASGIYFKAESSMTTQECEVFVLWLRCMRWK